MERSWASSRVGRNGERRAEESGGRMVPPGMLLVRGTEPSTAGSGLRRVDMVRTSVETDGVIVVAMATRERRQRGLCTAVRKTGGQVLEVKG
jgi:hypothetical protein